MQLAVFAPFRSFSSCCHLVCSPIRRGQGKDRDADRNGKPTGLEVGGGEGGPENGRMCT